jgi:hypothetical protein
MCGGWELGMEKSPAVGEWLLSSARLAVSRRGDCDDMDLLSGVRSCSSSFVQLHDRVPEVLVSLSLVRRPRSTPAFELDR